MRDQHADEAVASTDLRLWTHAEAVNAVPYLRSVVRTLREHWLAMQKARRQLQLIDSRSGRPDRQALVQREAAEREEAHAEERVEEALNELLALDVYCLDAAMGLAVIPSRQGAHMAWFVFDLFEPRGLKDSRFTVDPLVGRLGPAETSQPNLVDAVFSQGFHFGEGLDSASDASGRKS